MAKHDDLEVTACFQGKRSRPSAPPLLLLLFVDQSGAMTKISLELLQHK